jgi:tRNA threonylcarbamoyladenosine biosynthesis protein TsaE
MTSRFVVACADVAATQAAGAMVAEALRPGDVVLLDGDLGAGKTTFAQGLARALGVREPVTSPTFTLMQIYPTAASFDLCHVDVYRLERLSEVVDLALPELLEDGAAAIIEWGQKAAAALLPDFLRVDLALTDVEGERLLTFDSVGPRWEARLDRLHDALAA